MRIEITIEDVTFLRVHLVRHLQSVQNELLHCGDRELQHELACHARRLRALIGQLI